MATERIMAALGRPFTLGMLYDARKEQIVPGVTLWDENHLKKMTKKSAQHNSNSEITTSDSLKEKSSLLDMNASLQASFLAGLVTVEGSAKYLKDRKQSSSHSRVTFQYNATTIFKQLIFSADDLENAKQLSDDIKGSATHIVTGILYGAKALFVFDSQKSEATSVQEVEGRMKAVIYKIPLFNIDIKLTEGEKHLCENMTCTFYGDFLLKSNPATFIDAVKAYSDLPKLLKGNDSGVPMKVWMMPLKSLIPSAAMMMAEISPEIVRKVQDALEDLYELKMRCNICLEDGYNFPVIHDKLNNFNRCCDENTTKIQDILAKNISPIKEGEKNKEDELKQLIDNKEKSLFSSGELKKQMKKLEREITVIRSLEEMMKPAKVIPSAAELDREILDPEVEEMICFVFTSLGRKAEWYLSDELIEKARKKARKLGDLARALRNSSRYRCLVTAIDDPEHEGATIYHYVDRIHKDFEKLDINDVEKITARKELIWYATALTLDEDTANPNVSVSEDRTATYVEKPNPYPDLYQRFDECPQVLCKEKLKGRHYWEVEWNLCKDSEVGAGVCYGSMHREGKKEDALLGKNEESWKFGFSGQDDKKSFKLYNKNKKDTKPVPFTGCPSVGMFLHWEKGTLSCYIVTGEELTHIHTFKNNKFSDPVYPGFIVKNNSVRLVFEPFGKDDNKIRGAQTFSLRGPK